MLHEDEELQVKAYIFDSRLNPACPLVSLATKGCPVDIPFPLAAEPVHGGQPFESMPEDKRGKPGQKQTREGMLTALVLK